jgi:hypothetical protein
MRVDYATIPEITMHSLEAYIQYGQPAGGFLEAVLSNDLKNAVGNGDDENKEALVTLVYYLYNKVRSDCWGSKEKYENWLRVRGAEGLQQAAKLPQGHKEPVDG